MPEFRDAEWTLYGYSFAGADCLETVLTGDGRVDPKWAFAAWRSVRRSRPA